MRPTPSKNLGLLKSGCPPAGPIPFIACSAGLYGPDRIRSVTSSPSVRSELRSAERISALTPGAGSLVARGLLDPAAFPQVPPRRAGHVSSGLVPGGPLHSFAQVNGLGVVLFRTLQAAPACRTSPL